MVVITVTEDQIADLQSKLEHCGDTLRRLVGDTTGKQTRENQDSATADVRIRSSSRADDFQNSWECAWQNAIAELTAIRDALQRNDTNGALLHKHLLTHPEVLGSIHKVVRLTDIDWASQTKYDPKRT